MILLRPMAQTQELRLNDLDAQDFAILGILQRNSATPQRTIGEMVNLSASAVQRRISRMEKYGVIQANVAVVNPASVGQPSPFWSRYRS